MEAPLYALLVGVDRYASAEVPDLQGSANDVHAVRDLLVDTLGVPPDHVVELTDERATRDAIVGAFTDHLIARGDAWQDAPDREHPPGFLLYYSGHGSQARDVTGRETDGYHETIVPHDARQPDVFDIRDVELAAWLAALPGDNVTVILDCCHSGSGTRRPERGQQVRSAPPDERPQTDLLDREGQHHPSRSTRGIDAGEAGSHVLLAACGHHQEAFEYVGADDRVRGAFSYFLLPQLATILDEPGLTYRQVHERVRFPVNDVRSGQHPQCEGDVDRVLFSRERRPWSVHAAVIGIRRERVWFDAGWIHGVTPGTRMALERPGTRPGAVAVEHVEPVRCAGPLVDSAALPVRGTGAHLDRLDLGEHRWRLHLAVVDPRTAPLAAAAADGPLAGLVATVTAPDDADLVVSVEDERAVLMSGDGRRLVACADPLALVPAVAHVARFTWALHLTRADLGPGVTGDVDLQVQRITSDAFGEPRFDDLPRGEDGLQVDDGTVVALAITNRAGTPLHAAVVAFAADWSVRVLHPSVRGARERLAPGTTATIGTGDRSLTAELPPGRDRTVTRLRLVATTHPTSFDALALEPPPGTWGDAWVDRPPAVHGTPAGPRLPARRGAGPPSRWATADAVLITER